MLLVHSLGSAEIGDLNTVFVSDTVERTASAAYGVRLTPSELLHLYMPGVGAFESMQVAVEELGNFTTGHQLSLPWSGTEAIFSTRKAPLASNIGQKERFDMRSEATKVSVGAYTASAMISGMLTVLFILLFVFRLATASVWSAVLFIPLAIAAFGVLVTSSISLVDLRQHG